MTNRNHLNSQILKTEKLLVQKSLPLTELWNTGFSLQELQIMDIYLSRINSHDPEQRTVEFKKKNLEKMLGVGKINNSVLLKRLAKLNKSVTIPAVHENETARNIGLFSESYMYRNEEQEWIVHLECSDKAREYIFNIEELGYIRYRVKKVTFLKSRQAYFLFLYIEKNRFKGTWEVGVEELRNAICCNTEYYSKFKRFKEVLDRIQAELIEKAGVHYTYTPVKKNGNIVRSIRFSVPQIQNSLTTADNMESENSIARIIERFFWLEPLEEFGLTNFELEELAEIALTIPENRLPFVDGTSEIGIRRYHYMSILASELKRQKSKKNIKDKFSYLAAMIKKDVSFAPIPERDQRR